MKVSNSLQALLALTLVMAVDAATVRRSSHVLKEAVTAPSSWQRRGDAADHEPIALRFALKQSDVSTLEKRLRQTSDPDHPLYGQHLSREEVSKYLQPSKHSIEEVHMWLRDAGIHVDEDIADWSHSRDSFSVHLPVLHARELLNANLSEYEHADSGKLAIRAEKYSVPEHISEHLDYISPLTLFTEPQEKKEVDTGLQLHSRDVVESFDVFARGNEAVNMSQPGVPASCNWLNVTSQCLRDFYNTSSYTPQAPGQFIFGISGFLEQYAIFNDFNQFLKDQRPDAYEAGYNFTVESINGGINDQSKPGIEANLDMEIAAGMAYPIPLTFFTAGGVEPAPGKRVAPNETNDSYDTQMNYLLKLPSDKLPWVLSTSFSDDEQTIPKAYARRVCNYIMALGARGVSTIYGSGDNGVGKSGTCVSNGQTAPNGTAMFLPEFLSSCPYATSVGGTMQFAPEVVATNGKGFVAGGGFSDYFSRPWYQKKVVKEYVDSLGDQFQGLYNPDGRAYPDVSAQGYNYLIRSNGTYTLQAGTSLSTPLFASIVALLNDVRISQGKPSLGFLNPMIYKRWYGTPALNDITQGSVAGCNTSGFPATKGWDAASGAGTPNFEAMKCSLYA